MDVQQFKIQVLPLREKVCRLAVRMLRNHEDAEDTAQEVMLKLWMMRGQLADYRSVEALSIQISKNICINKLRARKHSADDAFESMPEPMPEPDRQLETTDSMATVARIIDHLSGTQRMVIRLRDIEGLPPAEIAEIMGCDESTVRVNLSRARKRVKEEFFKINNFSLL